MADGVSGETREIRLVKRNMVALVDAEDFEALSRFYWYAFKMRKRWYAARHAKRPEGTKVLILMHHDIMGPAPAPGLTIDHIETAATLDNRRRNLRWATHSEQMANRGIPANNTSGYKGVCWKKREMMWQAVIQHQGSRRYLGSYATAEEAHGAYRSAADGLGRSA